MAEAAGAVRAVRLRRRGQPPSFGFWLRGGREHGTGFFVSAVEPRSDAQRRGLRVGDQIVRVNGFPVDDAVHQEVLHFIQLQNHLTLKVRTTGMLPVKEKRTDPLTWCVVEKNNTQNIKKSLTEIPLHPVSDSFTSGECQRDVKMSITVTPKSKLGCGICKGPDWHTGIFVQFTKENGLAREAGLRPGDQIIECNGVKFDEVSFSEAVRILKGSRNLELLVRKGAGIDLFPGESSGYNSSASSVAGDQSPNWEDPKRLSVVKEESPESDERLFLRNECQSIVVNGRKDWKQIQYEWEEAEKEEAGKKWISQNNLKKFSEYCVTGSRTVIHLGENGFTTCVEKATENENVPVSRSSHEMNLTGNQQQQAITTVVVEVHQSDIPDEEPNQEPRVPPPPAPPPVPLLISNTTRAQPALTKSISSSSCASLASNMSISSLSSAISEELQRRLQQRKLEDFCPQEPKKCNKQIINNEKRLQHEQLMEEFKRVHRKMFACSAEEITEERSSQGHQNNELGDEQHIKKTDLLSSRKQNLNSNKEHVNSSRNQIEEDNSNSKNYTNKVTNGCSPDASVSSFSAKSSPDRTSPTCPTPDYDSISVDSSVSQSQSKIFSNGHIATEVLTRKLNSQLISSVPNKNVQIISKKDSKPTKVEKSVSNNISDKSSEKVEMESLESFKLTNPSGPPPRPPKTYFKTPKDSSELHNSSSSSDGSSTASSKASIKKHRPVSVIIGEYPSGKEIKQPSKFEFLGKQNRLEEDKKIPVTSLLQSELSQTLSRSNLKKQTEENGIAASGGGQVKESSEGGKLQISVNSDTSVSDSFKPVVSNTKRSDVKTKNEIIFNKVSLFNGTLKGNVKPSIQQTVAKLGGTSEKNSVTIVVSNENSKKDLVKSDTT